MRRLACLIALMALSSPASARGAYSFSFHGHRVHIAAHCRSLSCVSVSGLGNLRNRHDADDSTAPNDPTPAPAPTQVQPPPAAASSQALPAPVPVQPPPAPVRPPLVTAQVQSAPVITPATPMLVAAPDQRAQITNPVPSAPPPAVGFETVRPLAASVQNAARPQDSVAAGKPQAKLQENPEAEPSPASPAPRVSEQSEIVARSPLGDWQTDGKNSGLVRIEACGTALCGYALDASTGARGETVLVNMKPKNDTRNDARNDMQWTGNVYSRSSGNSYYGTMTLKRKDDTLRVEACALGRFLCSGNIWTRATGKSDELVSSQQAAPRS